MMINSNYKKGGLMIIIIIVLLLLLLLFVRTRVSVKRHKSRMNRITPLGRMIHFSKKGNECNFTIILAY